MLDGRHARLCALPSIVLLLAVISTVEPAVSVLLPSAVIVS